MRKHCSRKVRPKTPPMLVNRGIHNDELELVERQFVEAFAQGYADKIHFDSIADMCNILMIGSTEKGDKPVIELCKTMAIPMQSIRARHAKNGRFGATGEELKMLRVFCDVYRDWWHRQSVNLYVHAADSLQRIIYENKEAA